jgi:uncharacterized protein YciI
MPHYFLKLIAPRSTFAMDMDAQKKALMVEHFGYWKDKLDSGEVLIFGPVLDPKGPYGVGVIEAVDEAAARAFADADPVIKSRRGFVCDVYPMRAVRRETTTAP